MNSVFKAGKEVRHIRFGKGVVQINDGMRITVEFPEKETRQFGTLISAAKGIITSEEDGYAEKEFALEMFRSARTFMNTLEKDKK